MAEDASTPAAGASAGLGLPQRNKRNTPAKRAPGATATPSPAGKKAATTANKNPVAGAKRTVNGTAKKGNGEGKGGSSLPNAVAASRGNGNGGGDGEVDDEEVEVEMQTPSKKAKTASAGKGKGGTAGVEMQTPSKKVKTANAGNGKGKGVTVRDEETDDAAEGNGGTEYA